MKILSRSERAFLAFLAFIVLCCAVAFVGTVVNVSDVNRFKYITSGEVGAQINTFSASGNVTIFVNNSGGGTCSTSIAPGSFTNIVFGPGNWTFTGACAANTISNGAVKIRGAGSAATAIFIDSATSDLFTVSGSFFELSGIRVLPKTGVLRTAGSVIRVNSSGGSNGYVHDVELRDMFNGFTFDGAGVDDWTIDHAYAFSDGGNWNYFARTHGSSVGPTTASGFVFKDINANWSAATRTDAFFDFDSYTDTVKIQHTNVIVGGTVPAILAHDTDSGGAGQWPRWVHCIDCSFESAGTTLVNLVNSRDFIYEGGYISGAQIGIAIGAGAWTTKIIGNSFSNLNRQAITIAASNQDTVISGNTFETTGTDANNTYPVIDVAAGASFFTITSNTLRSFSPNLPSNFVNIAAGGSAGFVIASNVLNNLGGTAINNGSTGTNWFTVNNTLSNDVIAANQVTINPGIGQDYSVILGTFSVGNAYKFLIGNRDVRFDTSGTGIVRFSNGVANTATITPATGAIKAALYQSLTNCTSTTGTCAAAPSGAVTIAASQNTVTVATTAVSASSNITVTEVPAYSTRLGVTCNTTAGRTYSVTTITAGTSFVITASGSPATNPACLSYTIRD